MRQADSHEIPVKRISSVIVTEMGTANACLMWPPHVINSILHAPQLLVLFTNVLLALLGRFCNFMSTFNIYVLAGVCTGKTKWSRLQRSWMGHCWCKRAPKMESLMAARPSTVREMVPNDELVVRCVFWRLSFAEE